MSPAAEHEVPRLLPELYMPQRMSARATSLIGDGTDAHKGESVEVQAAKASDPHT